MASQQPKFVKRGTNTKELNQDLTFDNVQEQLQQRQYPSPAVPEHLHGGDSYRPPARQHPYQLFAGGSGSMEQQTAPGGEATPAFEKRQQTPEMAAALKKQSVQTTPAQHKIWHNHSPNIDALDESAETSPVGRGGTTSVKKATNLNASGAGKPPTQQSRQLLATGPQRFQYEYMPKVESEIDSERLTVDLDRNRQPTKTAAHMNRDVAEVAKSDATFRTIENPGGGRTRAGYPRVVLQDSSPAAHHKQQYFMNSASISQPAPEERSVMTSIVVNEARFEEQQDDEDDCYQEAVDLRPSQQMMAMETEAACMPAQISSFESEKLPAYGRAAASDSHRVINRMLRGTNQQSQSLEQLHGLKNKELHSAESDDVSEQLRNPQQLSIVQQNRHNTISYHCDVNSELNKDEDGQVNQSQNSSNHRFNVARNIRSTTMNPPQRHLPWQSEFAVTEAHGHDPIFVSSRNQPDDNISITVQGSSNVSDSRKGRRAFRSQAIQESVTDTHTVLNTQMQFVPRALESGGRNEDVQMSVTEVAHSHVNSIDARRSECVNVGPFEEEKSIDWREEKRTSLNTDFAAKTVQEQPVVQRTNLHTDSPPPKELSNLVKSSEKTTTQMMNLHESDVKVRDDTTTLQVVEPLPINNNNDYCLELDQDSLRPKQGITDRGPSTNNARSYGTGSENYDKVASDPPSAASSDHNKMQLTGFKPFASLRAPTESQPEEGSQEELFNLSIEVEEQAKDDPAAIVATKDFVDHQINEDMKDVDEHPRSDACHGSMIIQEESKWINTQMPDFDNSQQNNRQQSHKREVKSFEIKQVNNSSIMSSDAGTQNELAAAAFYRMSSIQQQDLQDDHFSQRESGVEQYESSDEMQAEHHSRRSSPNTIIPSQPAQIPFSSLLQHSSLTKEGTLLERSQASAGAAGIMTVTQQSETKDSMAFHTIQPVHMDASLNEDDNDLQYMDNIHRDSSNDGVCLRENTLTVTQMQLPESMGDTTQNLCVTDESHQKNNEALLNQLKESIQSGSDGDIVVATGRSKEVNDELDDDVIIGGENDKTGPESLHIFGTGSHLAQGDHPDEEAKRTLEPARSSSFDEQMKKAEIIETVRSNSTKVGAEKVAAKTKLKRKKRRTTKGSPGARVKKSKSSRSPPRDKPKMIIQQGKIVATTNQGSRENSFEKHQFPIRKANYNDSSVAKILLSRGQFRDSARMMHKMKTRLSQYNRDVMTNAQQYYYVMQNQQQQNSNNSRIMQQQEEKAGLNMSLQGQDSIEVQSDANNRSKFAMTPTGTDEANMISFEDQQSSIIPNPGALAQQRNGQRHLAQRTDVDVIDGGDINNIQVDTNGKFEVKRLSNSQHALFTDHNDFGDAFKDKLLSDFQDKSIEPSIEQTTDAVVRRMIETDSRHQQNQYQQLQNKPSSKTQQKNKEHGGGIASNASSSLHMTPTSHSDLRFRKKRQNRRLILVDSGNQYGSQNETRMHEHPEYFSTTAANNKTAGHRSTAISSICQYPQDNLSLLLRTGNIQPGGGLPTNQILRANLASRFAHNQLANRQSSQKNQTIDKIYKKVQHQQSSVNSTKRGGDCSDQLRPVKRKSSSQNSIALEEESFVQSNYHTTKNLRPAQQTQRQARRMTGSHSSQQNIAIASRMHHAGDGGPALAKYASTQPPTLAPNSGEPTLAYQQTRSQTVRDPETAENKFKKWLQKAPRPPLQPSARTNQQVDPDQAAAALEFNPVPQSQILEQEAEMVLAANDDHSSASGRPNASFDARKAAQVKADQAKINLSVALKFLNDPSYGQTIEQRKANLNSYIEVNYPEELKRVQQRQDPSNPLHQQAPGESLKSGSFEEHQQIRNIIERRQAIEQQREAEKLLIQQNSSLLLNRGTQPQNRSLPHISAPQQLFKLNQVHMARQAVDYSTQIARKKSGEKLDSLSLIYAAMSNGGSANKRRQIHLKNNYTSKQASQQQIKMNQFVEEARRSRSPRTNGHNPMFKKRQTLQQDSSSSNQQRQQSSQLRHSLPAQSHSYKPAAKTQQANTPSSNPLRLNAASANQANSYSKDTTSKIPRHTSGTAQNNALNPKVKAKRHKHHVKNVLTLEREDTFEHPQISLSMPQGSQDRQTGDSAEQVRDGGDVVAEEANSVVEPSCDDQMAQVLQAQIDQQTLQILNADVAAAEPSELVHDPANQGEEVGSGADYDVQEREVVESEQSLKEDVPQVLAEDDRNPFVPEQQDQILGEQTIRGDAVDSTDELRYVGSAVGGGVPSAAPAPVVSSNVMQSSFRLEIDSDQNQSTGRKNKNVYNMLSSDEEDTNQNHPEQLQDIEIAQSNTQAQEVPILEMNKVEKYQNENEEKEENNAAFNDNFLIRQNSSNELVEIGEDGRFNEEEEEDDDEYYADDKFVYEDVEEDQSSEDPEQKFLKKHAEETAREKSTLQNDDNTSSNKVVGLLSDRERDQIVDMYGDTPQSDSLQVVIKNGQAQKKKPQEQQQLLLNHTSSESFKPTSHKKEEEEDAKGSSSSDNYDEDSDEEKTINGVDQIEVEAQIELEDDANGGVGRFDDDDGDEDEQEYSEHDEDLEDEVVGRNVVDDDEDASEKAIDDETYSDDDDAL